MREFRTILSIVLSALIITRIQTMAKTYDFQYQYYDCVNNGDGSASITPSEELCEGITTLVIPEKVYYYDAEAKCEKSLTVTNFSVPIPHKDFLDNIHNLFIKPMDIKIYCGQWKGLESITCEYSSEHSITLAQDAFSGCSQFNGFSTYIDERLVVDALSPCIGEIIGSRIFEGCDNLCETATLFPEIKEINPVFSFFNSGVKHLIIPSDRTFIDNAIVQGLERLYIEPSSSPLVLCSTGNDGGVYIGGSSNSINTLSIGRRIVDKEDWIDYIWRYLEINNYLTEDEDEIPEDKWKEAVEYANNESSSRPKIYFPQMTRLNLSGTSFSNELREPVSLKTIDIYNSVEYISTSFAANYESSQNRGCINLEDVYFSFDGKLKSMPNFKNCKKLKSISIPPSMETISSECLLNTGITGLQIPSTVKEYSSMSACNLDYVTFELGEDPLKLFGFSTTQIDNSAIVPAKYVNLFREISPETNAYKSSRIFNNVDNIYVGGDCTYLPYGFSINTGNIYFIDEPDFPCKVEKIDWYSLIGLKAKCLKLPPLVKYVNNLAFSWDGPSACRVLEVGENMEEFAHDILYVMPDLSVLKINNPLPPDLNVWEEDGNKEHLDDYGINTENITLIVPENAVESYRNSVGWEDFFNNYNTLRILTPKDSPYLCYYVPADENVPEEDPYFGQLIFSDNRMVNIIPSGSTIQLAFNLMEGEKLTSLTYNGQDILPLVKSNKLALKVTSDGILEINGVSSGLIAPMEEIGTRYFDLAGRELSSKSSCSGVIICLHPDGSTEKILNQ